MIRFHDVAVICGSGARERGAKPSNERSTARACIPLGVRGARTIAFAALIGVSGCIPIPVSAPPPVASTRAGAPVDKPITVEETATVIGLITQTDDEDATVCIRDEVRKHFSRKQIVQANKFRQAAGPWFQRGQNPVTTEEWAAFLRDADVVTQLAGLMMRFVIQVEGKTTPQACPGSTECDIHVEISTTIYDIANHQTLEKFYVWAGGTKGALLMPFFIMFQISSSEGLACRRTANLIVASITGKRIE